MAQRIWAGEEVVRMSDGAMQALLRAWATRATAMAEDAEERAVADWLRTRASLGDAFPFDPLPLEISPAPCLRFFVRVMARFIEDLAAGPPPDTLDEVNWDDELRFWWLARLLDLDTWARRALPPQDRPPPVEEQLHLPPEARRTVEIQRLLRSIDERGPPRGAPERARLLDELITLVGDPGPDAERRRLLARLLQDRANVCVELGEPRRGAELLRRSLQFEEDGAVAETILDYARELDAAPA